jgi:hypothetical protein
MRNNQVTPHRYDFQVPFKRYLNVAHSERVIREEKKKKKKCLVMRFFFFEITCDLMQGKGRSSGAECNMQYTMYLGCSIRSVCDKGEMGRDNGQSHTTRKRRAQGVPSSKK